MLSILADALLVATRLDTANSYAKHPVMPTREDRDLVERARIKRTWAQIAGLRA